MANMSYCRWENTGKDMQDCVDAVSEIDNIREWFKDLDQYEQEGVKRAIMNAELLLELKSELNGVLEG